MKTAYAEFCYKKSFGLKATGIFVILLSQDGSESDFPETKVTEKHLFWGLFSNVEGLKVCYFMKK